MPPRGWRKYRLIDGKKRCAGCATYKLFAEFYKDNSCADGLVLYCKPCADKKYKEQKKKPGWREKVLVAERKRREDPVLHARDAARKKIRDALPEVKERNAAGFRRRHLASPRYTFTAIISNKRYRRELPETDAMSLADLMAKWEQQRGLCDLTGVPMTWAPGHCGPTATSISVDRIDCNGGYTNANTRLVCHWANSFRGKMSDAQLLEAARAMVAHMEKTLQQPNKIAAAA